MVCFCDIPLSEINLHTKKFGKYGIGVSKEWAGKQNITPVVYAHYESDFYNKIKAYSASITIPKESKENMGRIKSALS